MTAMKRKPDIVKEAEDMYGPCSCTRTTTCRGCEWLNALERSGVRGPDE